MKTLIREAQLCNPKYTNHSIRKTRLVTLGEAGIEGRHTSILAVTKVRQQ